MRAVLLTAGEGRRMLPLTATRPKPLLPVAGKPLLNHVMDACVTCVDGYVLIVGYKGNIIQNHVGDRYAGLPVEYIKQDEQLGTAHAVGQVETLVDEPFLVINGDVLLEPSVVEELATIDGNAVATGQVEDPSEYGVVTVTGEQVENVVEKPDDPPSELANLGAYAFTPRVFEHVDRTERSPRGEYEISETITRMAADGTPVSIVRHNGRWFDVGYPWDLLDAQEVFMAYLIRDVSGDVEDGATLHGPVVVESGAKVRAGTYLEGPVVVKSGADVGPNAYVRGSTTLGMNVDVGAGVEVKNSIIMADTTIPHLSYVGDSVVGEEVNFGGCTVVANLRHDENDVKMTVNGQRLDTSRRKLGVVVADRVKTGIGTKLDVGTKLGVGVTTRPGQTVTEDLGEEL